MRALVIVDLQYDFLPGGNLAVPNGDDIIPIINSIQDNFDLVVATQDWHPLHHSSFASSHKNRKPFEMMDLNGISQVLWPDHCIQGTFGANLSSEIDGNRIEAIFRKGINSDIDSYSGFFDNGKRKSTGMAGYLNEHKVRTIFICGLAGDFCVYYTATDAIDLGFDTFIIEDASRAINQDNFRQAMASFKNRGGKIIQSDDISSMTGQ